MLQNNQCCLGHFGLIQLLKISLKILPFMDFCSQGFPAQIGYLSINLLEVKSVICSFMKPNESSPRAASLLRVQISQSDGSPCGSSIASVYTTLSLPLPAKFRLDHWSHSNLPLRDLGREKTCLNEA